MSNRKILEKAIEAKINGESDEKVNELMHEYFLQVGREILSEQEFNDVEDEGMEDDFMNDIDAEDDMEDESFMDDDDLGDAEDELEDSMEMEDDLEDDTLSLDALSDEEKSELEDTLSQIQSLFDKINDENFDEDEMEEDEFEMEEDEFEDEDEDEDNSIGDDLDELDTEEEIEEAVELQKVNPKVDVGSEMGNGKKVSVEDNKLLPTDGHDVVKHKAGSMKLKGDEGKTKKPSTDAKGSNEVHNRVSTAKQTKATKGVDKGYSKAGVDPSGKGGSK